jgi:hypothetical protein
MSAHRPQDPSAETPADAAPRGAEPARTPSVQAVLAACAAARTVSTPPARGDEADGSARSRRKAG